MTRANGPKGPWFCRLPSRAFTVILGVPVYWLLGFLMGPIEEIPGPVYSDVGKGRVDGSIQEETP